MKVRDKKIKKALSVCVGGGEGGRVSLFNYLTPHNQAIISATNLTKFNLIYFF